MNSKLHNFFLFCGSLDWTCTLISELAGKIRQIILGLRLRFYCIERHTDEGIWIIRKINPVKFTQIWMSIDFDYINMTNNFINIDNKGQSTAGRHIRWN